MLENLPTPGRLLRIVGLSAAMIICVAESARGQAAGTLAYVVYGYEECQGCAQDESSPRYPLGLTVIHPSGSGHIRLTTNGADGEPAWSPDGFRLAFSSSGDVYTMPALGGTAINLTNDPADDGSPAWSPDGGRIAFTSDRGGSPELYLVDVDGSNVIRLTANIGYAGRPAWAPDGSILAFNCIVETGNRDICAITADGSTVTRLTADPARDSDPAWSPDGGTIAFATERYGTLGYDGLPAADIALMNPDGSGARPMTGGAAAEYPSWSPDGTQIAFHTIDPSTDYGWGGSLIVVVANVDGTGSIVLAQGFNAAWRPAGGNFLPFPSFGMTCAAHLCSFDASGSFDLDGYIAAYVWDFGDGTTGSGATVNHTYATGNPHLVTLTISDEGGANASGTRTAVPNAQPEAYAYVWCTGTTCSFDAAPSRDDVAIVSYVWEFGDGTAASVPSVSHTYGTSGIYQARLTVTDNEGVTGTNVWQALASARPIASFTFTCSNLACVFDGSASTDTDGTIAGFEWRLGYGTSGSGPVVSHTFPVAATYPVLLTVRDNVGLTDQQLKYVTVAPSPPPIASFTSSCGGLACLFDASTSSAPNGTVAGYEWAFGDGTYGSGRIVSHEYALPGTYNVLLIVRDNAGLSNEQRTNVTVTSAPAHVGDLDGAATRHASVWAATVTIEIHTSSHALLANATVSGSWANGTVASCVTGTSGRCSVSLSGIARSDPSVSFSVTGVSHAAGYRPDLNHDADGDGGGTTVVVRKP
jgi:PKD repeat protein